MVRLGNEVRPNRIKAAVIFWTYIPLSYILNLLFLKYVYIHWLVSEYNPPGMRGPIHDYDLTFMFTISPISLPTEILIMVIGTILQFLHILIEGWFVL